MHLTLTSLLPFIFAAGVLASPIDIPASEVEKRGFAERWCGEQKGYPGGYATCLSELGAAAPGPV